MELEQFFRALGPIQTEGGEGGSVESRQGGSPFADFSCRFALMLCARTRASLRFARILERLVLRDPGLWLCLWGCDGGLTGVSMSFLFYVSGLNPGRLSRCIGLIPDLGRKPKSKQTF